MSKDNFKRNDKKLANLFIDMYKNLEKHTKNIANLEEQLYKQYQVMAIDKQEELDNVPKIFKKKRAKLEQELKDLQDIADKHFKNFLNECNDLYSLHTFFTTSNKREEL